MFVLSARQPAFYLHSFASWLVLVALFKFPSLPPPPSPPWNFFYAVPSEMGLLFVIIGYSWTFSFCLVIIDNIERRECGREMGDLSCTSSACVEDRSFYLSCYSSVIKGPIATWWVKLLRCSCRSPTTRYCYYKLHFYSPLTATITLH